MKTGVRECLTCGKEFGLLVRDQATKFWCSIECQNKEDNMESALSTNTLQQHRATLLQYVYQKLEINDLHGAIDALMDMREIDAKISVLKKLAEK